MEEKGEKGGLKDKMKRGKRIRRMERGSLMNNMLEQGYRWSLSCEVSHIALERASRSLLCRPSHTGHQQDASTAGCHRSGCILKEPLSRDGARWVPNNHSKKIPKIFCRLCRRRSPSTLRLRGP